MMDFDAYQFVAHDFSFNVDIGHPVVYPAMGLAGEAGEILNKIKKIFRDDNSVLTTDKAKIIRKELGDVLWYLAEMCTQLEVSLDGTAEKNLIMLRDRQKRGVLHGDGDNR